MDVGTELKAARQRAGLSREQISQRTKIQVAKIEALEQNAFDRLPTGIYLDGIVRAYAHEVGLNDSDRLVSDARAAAIMSGSPSSHTDGLADLAPAGDDAIDHFPAETPELSVAGRDGFDEFPTEARPLPTAAGAALPEAERRSGWRNAVLPVSLIALFIGGAAFGAFVVYRAENREAVGTVASRPAESRNAPQTNKTPRVGTTGSAVPDAAARRHDTATPARPVPPAASVTMAPPAAPSEATARGPVSPSAAANAGTARLPEPEPRVDSGASASTVADLSGEWMLNTEVESSSLSTYEGLQLSYRLQLEQRGNSLRGSGRKVLENGKTIRGDGQTPITLQGTVDGDRLRLTFTERGARRPSSGTFVLNREGTDGLRGRFSSNAARSTGRVEARRASFTQLR